MWRQCAFSLIALQLNFLLLGCHKSEVSHKNKFKFQVSTPIRESINITRSYVCQIRSIQHIEVRALSTGYLANTFVDEGQSVESGSELFEILPRIYEAEYNKAQAEADFAKVEYENTKNLNVKNIVAESELNLAKAKLDKALADLSLAQVNLDFTKIKAPFTGIVGSLLVRKGSLVEEGELLTTLSDNHQMWVYYNVPEAEYINFKSQDDEHAHKDVSLVMANGDKYQHRGKITAILADFNNETGNISFRATFQNEAGLLRHGQTGTIIMDIPVKNALLIPQKATFEILEKKFVFVVDKKNRVHSQEIEVAGEIQDIYIVQHGLAEGDRILLEGLRRVKDGDEIEPNILEASKVFEDLKVYTE